jgi:Holliday junction DNA helicase RuvA
LKDKLQGFEALMPSGASVPQASLSPIDEDVLSALVNLGCARVAAEAALLKAKGMVEGAGFEVLFRKALELVR